MGSDAKLKILFFPFMAQGHIIPMVDMAKLFSSRGGVDSAIFTTPANASIIRPSIRNTSVHLIVVPFPDSPSLPQGCENAASLPSPSLMPTFFQAVSSLRQPFVDALHDFLPDCVVTDIFVPWTYGAAADLNIPRIVFHGGNLFSRCCIDSLDRHKQSTENLPPAALSDAEYVILPGLPHEIKLLKSQLNPAHTSSDSFRGEFLKQIRDADSKSYGSIVNSFHSLEPDYVKHYERMLGRRTWLVGPVSLCNSDVADKSGRGEKAAIDEAACSSWLDGMAPRSVVYVCFGSMGDFPRAQLRELALGLEASGRPFIWVVRKEQGGDDETAMPEGFEERTRGRGMVVRGWAPQILILSHPAVGCFVTHCGWNSSLEGIAAGLPLVTWPLFADQFFNERLIVDVLKIGVAVGVKEYVIRPEDREVIAAERIEGAVSEVMGGGEEAEERRRRAEELGEEARRAVEEGGSSFVDMTNLIQELVDRRGKELD